MSTSVTLTGSLLAVDAPVVASTPAKKKDDKTDDNGFFAQWSKQASDKGVKAIDGTEDNLAQTVAGDNPDLIVVAKTGQDSAIKVVDSLRQLEVPVLVIDYGSHSWQDVTKTLGQATGRQAKADSVVKDYTTKAEKTKSAISVPQVRPRSSPSQGMAPRAPTPSPRRPRRSSSSRTWASPSPPSPTTSRRPVHGRAQGHRPALAGERPGGADR